MKTTDVLVIGAGIIGLSLASSLRSAGAQVVVLDRGEPGHEASSAAAGMLSHLDPETPLPLRQIAHGSAALYPQWIEMLEAASGINVDFRREGALYITSRNNPGNFGQLLAPGDLALREPCLEDRHERVYLAGECSVDPRLLFKALYLSAKRSGVHCHGGNDVREIDSDSGSAIHVRTQHDEYAAGAVVNCAGAWAASIGKNRLPVRPIKGQMLAVLPTRKHLLRHVIRSEDVYLVPRADGRILIGATVEDAGFDKQVEPQTILRMFRAATKAIPELSKAKIHESWAGLRPGTQDTLPILGPTAVPGYFVATGHYRNGILLAPVTAGIMTDLILGGNKPSTFDLEPFRPARFQEPVPRRVTEAISGSD